MLKQHDWGGIACLWNQSLTRFRQKLSCHLSWEEKRLSSPLPHPPLHQHYSTLLKKKEMIRVISSMISFLGNPITLFNNENTSQSSLGAKAYPPSWSQNSCIMTEKECSWRNESSSDSQSGSSEWRPHSNTVLPKMPTSLLIKTGVILALLDEMLNWYLESVHP